MSSKEEIIDRRLNEIRENIFLLEKRGFKKNSLISRLVGFRKEVRISLLEIEKAERKALREIRRLQRCQRTLHRYRRQLLVLQEISRDI